MGNIHLCTFPILLHLTRSYLSLCQRHHPACPTLATTCFPLVANVLALGLADGFPTPSNCSVFPAAATMPLSQSKTGQMPYSSKVCRSLFGPVDHQQLQNDLEDLLRQHLEEAQQRWNFNFETETPLEGQFKWERVCLAEQPPQEVHSLVRSPSSESRSSLVHKAPPKDHLGRICPEGSQQSSEVYRAGSPQSLKRGQTTIKGECWRLRGIVDVMAFLAGIEGIWVQEPFLAPQLVDGTTLPASPSPGGAEPAFVGKGCKSSAFWMLGVM